MKHLEPIDLQVKTNRADFENVNESVESCQSQIRKLNSKTNAVIWQDDKHIEEQIEQLRTQRELNPDLDFDLLGCPILVKELDSSISGTPNAWGNLQLKNEGFCDSFTSTSVTKLMNAGAIVMGKTNNPELGLTVTTQSKAHGDCNNPLDLTRNSGGSSGGSAASVASSMTSVALGSDGGGSIRIPASVCGIFGFKPSRGVIPLGPMIEEAWAGLVCKGLVASNLNDLTSVLNVFSDFDNSYQLENSSKLNLETLKIGIRTDAFSNLYEVNPEVKSAIELFATYLSDLGCQISYSNPTAYDDESIIETFLDVISYNTYQDVEFLKSRTKSYMDMDSLENETKYFYDKGSLISKETYLELKKQLISFSNTIDAWHQNFDFLITPTTCDVAPIHGEVEKDPELSPFIYGGLCFPSNIAGAPALSIPVRNHSKNGLPVGIQIIGKRGSDNLVLNFGEFCNSDYSDIFVTQIRDITN